MIPCHQQFIFLGFIEEMAILFHNSTHIFFVCLRHETHLIIKRLYEYTSATLALPAEASIDTVLLLTLHTTRLSFSVSFIRLLYFSRILLLLFFIVIYRFCHHFIQLFQRRVTYIAFEQVSSLVRGCMLSFSSIVRISPHSQALSSLFYLLWLHLRRYRAKFVKYRCWVVPFLWQPISKESGLFPQLH